MGKHVKTIITQITYILVDVPVEINLLSISTLVAKLFFIYKLFTVVEYEIYHWCYIFFFWLIILMSTNHEKQQ